MATTTSDDTVLFQRGEDNESDTWDDSVLIKAYDDAISSMKAKLANENPEFLSSKTLSTNKKKKKKSKSKKKQSSTHWKSGDRCRAVYSEDGEVYEARIMSVDQESGVCTVQYIGYGNEEEQLLSDLFPPGTAAPSRKTDTASETESVSASQTPSVQEVPASKSKNKRSSRQDGAQATWNGGIPPFAHLPSFPPFNHMTPPPPNMFPGVPPPPPLFSQFQNSGDDNEVLYSMLISWYMSGYHTGYYQGLRQASVNSGAASGHKVPR